ncbi:TetR/AcrR family transcriptional regulator [Saccharopolyspora sp. K220]|uniref:TetR/AcrR family transcriptional regulator n=1 Tax=Saccharopolyspora soli TaxID=2926618 RepID=UPI001F5A1595|nr:TetR/AcrR family transcriptional regulator [Saccharopolyspora soli]MCI2422952.1 TetR/AcrR family transcriptional regulator [Saccharopolyspora soli]
MAAAERLLGQRSLQEISIDDLTRCVGISRPAFYFYFRSKDDVLLALLDRVAAESFTVTDRLFRSDSDDPAEQWRQGINAGIRAFREHRGVLVATAYAKATNPEVRQLWSTIMMNWVHLTAKTIDAERRRGAALPGIPAQELATALNLMNERIFFATFTDDQPAIPESGMLNTLLELWLRSIYGTTSPPTFAELPPVSRQRNAD